MNTPNLRFPSFNNHWDKTQVGKVSKVSSGGTPSRANKSYWKGSIPWVTTSLINFNEIESANEFITEEALNNSSAKLFSKGTLLIAMYGQGATRGKVALLNIDATTNQACAAIKLDSDRVSNSFAFYQLMRNYEDIRNLANDGGQKNLSGGLIKSLPVSIPSLKEQHKISDFLSSVDNKINLLKQKHALLEQYKKGVVQKLLSQEIRFKGENGNDFPDWQEERFSNILQLQLNSLQMNDESEYELITVRRRNGGIDSRGIYKGKEVLVKNQYGLKTNQFVISKRQIVHGACGLVPEELAGAIVSNEYNVFEPVTEKLDINYFNMIATSLPMRRAFFINSDGVHIEKLLFKTQSWLKTKLDFPCVEEQRKIVSFIDSLDKKLELVSQQIEQTQTFKKGLLQQMFV
jgi:type I restriction enzyme S subunit